MKITEREWNACDDYRTMLTWCGVGTSGRSKSLVNDHKPSPRKLRLLACAVCRRYWEFLADPRSRRAVEVAEAWADGNVTDKLMKKAEAEAWAAHVLERSRDTATRTIRFATRLVHSLVVNNEPSVFWSTAIHLANEAYIIPAEARVENLLREVFNPFLEPIPTAPAQSILTRTSVQLANSAYEDRHPDGRLNSELLGVLADSLETDGWREPITLAHLRAPCPYCKDLEKRPPAPKWWRDHTASEESLRLEEISREKQFRFVNRQCVCGGTRLATHYRGCWALDMVLGKE